jgi:hypothetical protein
MYHDINIMDILATWSVYKSICIYSMISGTYIIIYILYYTPHVQFINSIDYQ